MGLHLIILIPIKFRLLIFLPVIAQQKGDFHRIEAHKRNACCVVHGLSAHLCQSSCLDQGTVNPPLYGCEQFCQLIFNHKYPPQDLQHKARIFTLLATQLPFIRMQAVLATQLPFIRVQGESESAAQLHPKR